MVFSYASRKSNKEYAHIFQNGRGENGVECVEVYAIRYGVWDEDTFPCLACDSRKGQHLLARLLQLSLCLEAAKQAQSITETCVADLWSKHTHKHKLEIH